MVDLPRNEFKRALKAGKSQIGFWSMLPHPYVTEILCNAGFDWLLLDVEHSQTSLETVGAQIGIARTGTASIIVRPPVNNTAIIKQYLDVGAQTLLLPMVNTPEEAKAAVAAMRYPPEGVRGVAGATRATRFGRVENYHKRAAQELCLLVQIETREALDNIEAIAAIDGVDGLFIGPADLAAGLGHLGELGHPDVVATIKSAIKRIRTAGKPPGILSYDHAFLRDCIELGTLFTAVGGDIPTLLTGAESLAAKFMDTDS